MSLSEYEARLSAPRRFPTRSASEIAAEFAAKDTERRERLRQAAEEIERAKM